jgi:hypothetical protein
MKQVAIGKIIFSDIKLNKNQIPFFRGAVAGQFKQFDMLHNHSEDGRVIYRYAAVQFKTDKKKPLIYAVGRRAIEIFKPIFLNIEKINLNGREYNTIQKEFIIKNENTGIVNEQVVYNFKSAWIALNQVNYLKYKTLSAEEKRSMLKRIAVNNIIGFSKYIQYTVPEKIFIELKLKPISVMLKGEKMIGFTGFIKTNFLLPDGIGIGKSISRGYGIVEKVI